MHFELATRRLALAAVATLALTACGGSDETSDAGEAGSNEVASNDAAETDGNTASNGTIVMDDGRIIDAETSEVLYVPPQTTQPANQTPPHPNRVGAGAIAGNIDTVVDTCTMLPAQQLSDITNVAAGEFSSVVRDYTSESFGARCVYTWENSIVEVVIGATDQLSDDASAYTPAAGFLLGELVEEPWRGNSDVTLVGDGLTGATVTFAAHRTAGDLRLAIVNANGTLVDPSLEGDVFGQALDAAAANLG